MVVDANGIPIGAIAAPANRPDSPLLEATLDTMEIVGELPEHIIPESGYAVAALSL